MLQAKEGERRPARRFTFFFLFPSWFYRAEQSPSPLRAQFGLRRGLPARRRGFSLVVELLFSISQRFC